MEDIGAFILLWTSPALVVVGMARFGALRRWFVAASTVVIASITPGAILFFATREADSITNAAAYYVAPMFCIYGLFVALVTAAIMARSK
ncbi:MAG TPA: hypothetical protein VFT56_11895 [Sphingomonas sp.]|nr:hypothetical protein [Sphingomonas sp.]